MTDLRAALGEIQQRADAATDGPWGVMHGDTIATEVEQSGRGSFSFRHKVAELDDLDYDENYAEVRNHGDLASDAEFIAAARTDVPRLAKALADVLDLADSNSGLWTFEIRTVVAAALAGES